MSTISLTFPDSTYSSSNKPSIATLKSDLQAIETGHNDLETNAITSDSTTTMTNKAIVPRSNTVASAAAPVINTNTTDVFTITAQAEAITSMTTNLSGSPSNGQKLIIRIKDNGTARGITWGASFASRGATLPTTTVISKYLYVGLIYNSTASVWDCVATSQEV